MRIKDKIKAVEEELAYEISMIRHEALLTQQWLLLHPDKVDEDAPGALANSISEILRSCDRICSNKI